MKKYISQYVIGETLPNGLKLVKAQPIAAGITDFIFDNGVVWRLSESTEVREDGFMGPAGGFPPTQQHPAREDGEG